jgi:hypothetical protein
MSWRSYFRTNLVEACDPSSENPPAQTANHLAPVNDSRKEIQLLLEKIGKRDVVVDACLPPQLATELRRNNINAIWVPAILGDGASDDEILRELFFGNKRLWGNSSNQKVLLTRDVEFYRRVEKKAILVNHRTAKLSGGGFSPLVIGHAKKRFHRVPNRARSGFKNYRS